MKMQYIHFLDYVSYLPMALRKLPRRLGFRHENPGFLTTLIARQIWTM
jgi:hypothetical protein